MSSWDFGMVGLGVMGQNLALNLAEKGTSVAAYDAWPEPVDRFNAATAGAAAKGFQALPDFVASLKRPRRIILLVKAGEVVDKTLAALTPLLEKDDIVIDGGNEFYKNTERRAKELAARGLRYFGMGVSGGEEGARHGPSLMPGGDKGAYDLLAPVLTRIAAQADGPCVTYVGPGGSGHYVKMVHNGIEYGDMQLIAEAYDLLKHVGGLDNARIADTFEAWNAGPLQSFLIEISARIFRQRDPDTGKDLVDLIVDAASQKGTGRWTVQEANEAGVPVPTLAAAVDARLLSSDRALRQTASKTLAGPTPDAQTTSDVVAQVEAALFCAKACSYAQGLSVLRATSAANGWALPMAELARIWTGGCIIRARFLGNIKEAFLRQPDLANLVLDPWFRDELAARQDAWRTTVARATEAGIPVAGIASALGYYDALRRARLPANLIQAQRDLFGAHTFERVDKPGTFHADWSKTR